MAVESGSGVQSCRSDWGGCLGGSARTVPVGCSLRGGNGLGWRRGRCLAGCLVVVGVFFAAGAVAVRADLGTGLEAGLQLQPGRGLVVVGLVVSTTAVLVRADADAGFQVRLELHFEIFFLSGARAVFVCI